MPTSPPHVCPAPGCRATTRERYCPVHAARHAEQVREQQRAKPDLRPTATARGYDADWRELRARFLAAHPHCSCGAPATEVDHVVAIARGGGRLDWSNLAALCKPCHSRKTIKQDGGFGKSPCR